MPYSNRLIGLGTSVVNWARSPFPVMVPSLVAIVYASIVMVNLFELPDLLLLPAMALYLVAAIATFYELQDKGRSGWWILLMVAQVKLGPMLLDLSLGALINVLPVIMAMKPAKDPELQA